MTHRPGHDLGIAGAKALVCGSSSGLGFACAASLARAGADVVINGRNRQRLENAAHQLADMTGSKIHHIVADVMTEEGREKLGERLNEIDILVTNAQGPPTGGIDDWDEANWLAAVRQNMVGPILLIRAALPGMRGRGWGRIINITSGAVKAPLPLLGLSNGARAGLTGFISGLAREVAIDGVTINNLLPGNFATDRLKSYVAAVAERQGKSFDTLWDEMQQQNPAGRFGDPAEFGEVCAFVASRQAAYLNAQNILLDGGAYPGVF